MKKSIESLCIKLRATQLISVSVRCLLARVRTGPLGFVPCGVHQRAVVDCRGVPVGRRGLSTDGAHRWFVVHATSDVAGLGAANGSGGRRDVDDCADTACRTGNSVVCHGFRMVDVDHP